MAETSLSEEELARIRERSDLAVRMGVENEAHMDQCEHDRYLLLEEVRRLREALSACWEVSGDAVLVAELAEKALGMPRERGGGNG